MLSHPYSYPGTHARKFHMLTHWPRHISSHRYSYTYCPNSHKHALSPTRAGRPGRAPDGARPEGLLTPRERASLVRAAAPGGGSAQLGLQRPGQPRGRPLPRAPAPRGPSPPTPRGGRRTFHDSAPPAKPLSRVSHRRRAAKLFWCPLAVETSRPGLQGALEWGRGQA